MLVCKWALLLLPFLNAHTPAPTVSKELQSLEDQARGLPPDFAADILLKLAASPLAKDPQWRRTAIEEAFLTAAAAKAPYLKRGNVRIATGDLVGSRLSRLGLQTTAVEAMLALDPQRALTLFQDITAPELPKLSCQSPHTPDVSAYYTTAAAVFTQAFSTSQRRNGDDIHFLRQRIAGVQSPSQVVPALKLLDQVELSSDNRAELMALFAGVLDRVSGGDREFAASEPLLVGAAVPEMHETPIFLPALRAYIVRQLSGPRCSDHMNAMTESATGYNKLISQIDRSGTLFHRITPEETAALRDDGTYDAAIRIQSPSGIQANKLLAAMPLYETANSTWTMNYFEVLRLLDDWKPTEESTVGDYSFMAVALYGGLLQRPGPLPIHRSGRTNALHFLERGYSLDDNPGLWLWAYDELFRSSLANGDRAWLLDQWLHSSNPAIAAYSQLHKLLDPS